MKAQTHLNLIYGAQTWEMVKHILLELAQQKVPVSEMPKTFNHLTVLSQTRRVKYVDRSLPTYKVLLLLYEKELPQILAGTSKFVLDYELNPPKIPIFLAQIAQEHTFDKEEMLLLMCMMTLGIYPSQPIKLNRSFHSADSFSYIFS